MNGQIDLSIIVPAFNEEKRIIPTLEKIDAYIKSGPRSVEVLVVDDCSRDRTAELVEAFSRQHKNFRLIRSSPNLGKGAVVRRGMLEARGKARLFSDADLSTPIEEVERFFSSSFDVVIGSRRVRGANVAKRQPLFREAAGRVFSVLVRLLTLRGFIDTQCGFKFFRGEAAEQIFKRQTINRFGFDVEILFIAQKLGYTIREAPVTWVDSPFTRVRLFRDSAHMFLDLIRIRLNDSRGVYQ